MPQQHLVPHQHLVAAAEEVVPQVVVVGGPAGMTAAAKRSNLTAAE